MQGAGNCRRPERIIDAGHSGGLVTFLRVQLGKPVPSPVVPGQLTERFREPVKAMAEREQIPLYQFGHKERKDGVANTIRQQRGIRDGIVFIGVAQEKAQAGANFGPLFLKVCSYAPWGTKLCLNGHEWPKRQLEKQGIAYEALDNGFLPCPEPEKLQQICDSLGPDDIDRVFRKWLARIPCRYGPKMARPDMTGICRSGRWQ